MDGHIWCLIDNDLHTKFKFSDEEINNAGELLKAFLSAHNKLNKHKDYEIYIDNVKIHPHTSLKELVHKTNHAKPVHFKRTKNEHSVNYKIEKSFSQLTHSNLVHIMKYFDIKSVNNIKLEDYVSKEFLNENKSYAYEKFKWPESNKIKTACEHILTHLKLFNIDMSKFKLEDVHLLDDKLFIETNKYIFKGGTDAAIIAKNCWSCMFELQMRVVFELKEFIKIDENNYCNEYHNETLAKLIACYAASTHPVILILTDLKDNFEIFNICDNIQHLKLKNGKEAFIIIKQWLGIESNMVENSIIKDYKTSCLNLNKIQERELSKRCLRRHFPEGYCDLDMDYGF